jgi:hypothetical protein
MVWACAAMRRIRNLVAADGVTLPDPAGVARLALRSGAMPNRMNRDEFNAAMARHDDACLRKILWTVYWRGNAQLRERIEDELRPQDQPKVKPDKELPDPAGVLDEVTTFVGLAKAATLVTKCLKEMPGHQAYLDFAVKLDAELPSRAREIAAERARAARYAGTT